MRKRLLFLMLSAIALASVAQQPPISYLEINNVRPTILGDGTNYVPQQYNSYSGQPKPCTTWEVPVGTGHETIFQHALWLAGLDQSNTLHGTATQYKQEGLDLWSGPLKTSDASIDLLTSLKYHHVWSLTRAEIEQFIANHDDHGYRIPEDIMTWPAHGDEGYAANLAPFVDVNGDGRYNPTDGDYPDIKGDQCLFFIFNDGFDTHTESGGEVIGLEVHAMVYGFDAPNDEALNNTVFINYKMFNRSPNNYHQTYLGLFTDWDLGYSRDDYVGCDVQRNSCYVYNGLDFDGSGEAESYGDNPPVQVLTILNSPDGLGMTGFMSFNASNSVNGDPHNMEETYYLLQSRWLDGSHLYYGGYGYLGMAGTVGPECNYMYPGDSDPNNIGTGGIAPGDGYNTNGKFWTEESAGNAPGDRRGLATVGPFDFPAGGMKEVDYAMITVWKNNSQSAMERKGEFIDHIKTLFENGFAK